MKIQIKKIDNEKQIVQITTTDSRWYQIGDKFVPSVTWICSKYPKGVQFYKWLADKGWDEAEAIKQAAGDKGSKVHNAIEDILKGKEVKIDDKYVNNSTGQPEELTVQEYECIMSFVAWLTETNPEVIATEYVVYDEAIGYAGTVDMKLKINGEIYIVDIKTSQQIWPEYELQLSAYRQAEPLAHKTAILQVGYNRNKSKFKFTEIENKFGLFLAAKEIWANEELGVVPLQKDYPLSLQWKPELKVEPVQPKLRLKKQIKVKQIKQ